MESPLPALKEQIAIEFPEVTLDIDLPDEGNTTGDHFLDITHGSHFIVIEYRPDRGFGITSRPDSLFGERADEVGLTFEGVLARALHLLRTGESTTSPYPE